VQVQEVTLSEKQLPPDPKGMAAREEIFNRYKPDLARTRKAIHESKDDIEMDRAFAIQDKILNKRDMEADAVYKLPELRSPPKFSAQTIPGGENYREVMLTLPEKTPANFPDFDSYFNERYLNSSNGYTTPEAIAYARRDAMRNWKNSGEQIPMSDASAGNYTSSHFDQPNILAHMRLNDRVVDGKPTLFIEEIQSDWHQAGRKKGYRTGNERSQRAQVERELTATTQKRSRLLEEAYALPDSEMTKFITMNEEIKALATHATKLEAKWSSLLHQEGGVPDAPFKTTWDELTLKRAIKMAGDEGYDKIAFTTGKTQAERYGLSKQISQIRAQRLGDKYQLVVLDNKESTIYNGYLQPRISAEEMEDLVGKEMANKIVKNASPLEQDRKLNVYSGLDLQVGGEGMKGFYDKMLPKKLEKLGKQYDVKVNKTMMNAPGGDVEVWSMDVPAEMKEKVSSQGQPLFQIGAGAAGTAGIMGLSTGEENQGEQ